MSTCDVNSPAVVAAPTTHLFVGSGRDKPLNTQLRLGEVVAVLETDDTKPGWTRVRAAWGLAHEDQPGVTEGWVESAALLAADSSDAAACYAARLEPALRSALSLGAIDANLHPQRWLQVTALAANLFAVPSRKRAPAECVLPSECWLAGLKQGECVDATATSEDGWWNVLLPDGREFWVQAGDVVADGLPALDAQAIVGEASRMLGRPYVWAGTSSFGYDCSGLTQMLARRCGIGLPHLADQHVQVRYPRLHPVGEDRTVAEVAAVARPPAGQMTPEFSAAAEAAQQRCSALLQPGDFLYFSMNGKLNDHVGIWAGDGDMIHASSGGEPTTRRERLWGGKFAARMTAVRRVV